MSLGQTIDRWLLSRAAGWVIRLVISGACIVGCYLLVKRVWPGRASSDASSQRKAVRVEVPHPPMTGLESSVQEHLREVRAVWQQVQGTPNLDVVKKARADAELGRVYLAYNFPDAARVCFENAETGDPRDYRWPYLQALAFRAGAQDEPAALAMERAKQALEGDLSVPREIHVAALCFLGHAYSQLGAPTKAVAALEEATSIAENCLFAPFQLGRLAVDRGDYGQAVQHFERALKLAPRNPTIRHALAAAYRAQGQADKAAELTADLPAPAGRDSAIGWLDPLLNQVQALNVSSFELVKRGMNAARQGRYEQAVKVLDTALKINPNNASAWTNLGVASANLGQYHKALEAYRKAEELEPNIVETQLGIGRVLLEMGSSVDGAIERFEAVRQKDPGNATAMIYIAAAEMRRGRWEIALEPLQTVLARQPGNALARIGEARCLYALDRYADAKQSLEKGYRVEPRSVALADALARLLATCPDPAQRDGARSLELSQRVFTQAKTIVYAETVAMAYAELGRFDEAVKQQTWALTQSPAGTRAEVRQRIQENLNLYQDKKPCREPWPASCSYPPRRITSADEET